MASAPRSCSALTSLASQVPQPLRQLDGVARRKHAPHEDGVGPVDIHLDVGRPHPHAGSQLAHAGADHRRPETTTFGRRPLPARGRRAPPVSVPTRRWCGAPAVLLALALDQTAGQSVPAVGDGDLAVRRHAGERGAQCPGRDGERRTERDERGDRELRRVGPEEHRENDRAGVEWSDPQFGVGLTSRQLRAPTTPGSSRCYETCPCRTISVTWRRDVDGRIRAPSGDGPAHDGPGAERAARRVADRSAQRPREGDARAARRAAPDPEPAQRAGGRPARSPSRSAS